MNAPLLRRLFRAALAGVALFGTASSFADTEIVDGIKWTYTVFGNEAMIGGGYGSPAVSKSTTGALTIPDSLGGCPVTTIGDGAFCDCSNVTSVTIQTGVTRIGADAFWRCSGLKSVTIPASVTSIGYRAFARCTGLTSIEIPSGVTSVEDLAFAGCSGLASVTIPDGVDFFGYAAFHSCTGLTSVSISAGVSDIRGDLFRRCSGLLSFSVANGNASYCASNGLLLTKDGKRLVCGVNGAGTIPNGVETIEFCAFEGRFGLTTVSIPGTVTNIEHYAFSGCSGLTAFAVDPVNPAYSSSNGLLLSKDGKMLLCGVNGDVTIPDSVTRIGQGAFSGLSGLESVTIPDGVTDIYEDTFSGCSGLASISFGKGLESVDWEYVFYDCSALASITVDDANPVLDSRNGCNAVIWTANNELVFGCRTTIVPDGVTGIGYSAFANCSGLVSIEIPDSVTSIGWGAFENCSNLVSITIPYAFKDVLSASGIPENCRVETRAPLQLAFRTPPTWPVAVTDAEYSPLVDVIGGLRPYRFEIVDFAAWPYWLSSIEDWSDDGDRPWLWGVPGSHDTGANTFAIRVTDANGTSVTNTFTLVVEKNDAPVIESWTPDPVRFRIDPVLGTNFTVSAFDADGDALSYSWDVYVLDGDYWSFLDRSKGVSSFSFLPLYCGRFRVEVQVSDGFDPNRHVDWHNWNVTVAPKTPLAIETATELPPAWTEGWYSRDLKASGGEEPYTWAVVDPDELPGWLGIDNSEWLVDSRLCGCPEPGDVGTNVFTLCVTDAEGTSVTNTFTLAVERNDAPVIESWTPEESRFRLDPGAITNFTVTAYDPDGDALSYGWSVIRKTGAYSLEYVSSCYDCGSNSFDFYSFNYEEGRYKIEASVSDGAHSTSHEWTVVVADKALAIKTDARLPFAKTDSYYSQMLEATGGEEPYTWTIVNPSEWPNWLPRDCVFRWEEWGYDGPLLRGTPYEYDAGTNSFTLRVTDAKGTSVERTFTLEVRENPNHKPVIESWTPESSRFRLDPGTTTNFTVTASDPDGDELSYHWNVYVRDGESWSWVDSPDNGNSLAFDSAYYGKGCYNIDVYVNDGEFSAWRDWTVTVGEKTPLTIVTDAALPVARTGWYYGQSIVASGGEEPYRWEMVDEGTGSIWIGGWSEDSCWIYGYPYEDDVGTNALSICVTDAAGTNVTKTFMLVVERNDAPEIESWTPEATVFRIDPNATTNFTVTASDPDGDELTCRWTVNEWNGKWMEVYRVECGDSFVFRSSAFGEGRYRIEASVSDGGYSVSRSWTIVIAPKTPLAIVTDATLPIARTGWWYDQPVEATGGEEPYTWVIVNGDDWPNGLWRDEFTEWEEYGFASPRLRGYPDEEAAGTHAITISVTDAEGTSVTNMFTIVVEKNDAPVIERWTPEATWFRIDPGATTNFTVTASDSDGDELSYHWSIYRITENGWSDVAYRSGANSFAFNASAYGEGRYRIEASVSDGGYSVSRSWTIVVAPKTPLAIVTDATLPAAKCGWYYSQPLKISGGEEPYSVEIVDHDAFPDWLWAGDIENLDGWKNGDPRFYGHPYGDNVGTNSFTLRVADAEGTCIEKTFTLVVLPNASPVIESWTPESPRFRIDPGAVTNFSVTASDSDDDELSYHWQIAVWDGDGWLWKNSYERGNSFAFNASAYGEGRYRIEASVSDGGYSVSRSWTIVVAPKTPLAIVTDATLPAAKCGWYYSQPLKISGGEEPYSVEILDHDAFPDWLWSGDIENLDGWTNGDPEFYGHPYEDDAGTYSFTLRVTDAEGTCIEKTFTLVVLPNASPVIEFWTPESPRFRIDPGAVTNFSVTASDHDNDKLSYRWSVYRTTENGWSEVAYRSGANSFAFNSSAYGEGRYEIYVSVSDGGHSTGHSWIIIVAEEAWTMYTPAPVPYAWLERYYTALDTREDYEDRAFGYAANGTNAVWECYVAGLDPTNATSRFSAEIDATVDPPRVTWTPDLNEGGTKSERVYTVEGKANLGNTSWGPTNEATRFFRVKVSMPE